MKPLIYLAAPYSHPDPAVIAGRMSAFDALAAQMLLDGDHVVSPLLFHSLLGQHKVPGNWDFFEAYSLGLLDRCNQIVVIPLAGWSDSVGVQAEIEYARLSGLSLSFLSAPPGSYTDGVVRALSEEFPHLSPETIRRVYQGADTILDTARSRLQAAQQRISDNSRAVNEAQDQ